MQQQEFEGYDERQLQLWPVRVQIGEQVSATLLPDLDSGPRPRGIGEAVTQAHEADASAVVFTLATCGPSIEGTAIIVSRDATPNHYRVRFVGERVTRLRFVHPDWQADPERALGLLTQFWRSCRRDAPLIEDFFPDDNRKTSE